MARIKKGETRTNQKIQQEFLTAYEDTGNVTVACKKVKLPRRTFYNWIANDTAFKTAFDESNQIAVGLLEDEAHRRAVDGVKEGVFYKGRRVAYQQKYSDTLLIVLLKAHAPERYKDRTSTELTGKDGKPIKTEVTHHVIFSDNGG
jgi:hypothetical protein